MPAEIMDHIAIAWIKERKLQGALGGSLGDELGSPNNPWSQSSGVVYSKIR
jgi:hypothetical protein